MSVIERISAAAAGTPSTGHAVDLDPTDDGRRCPALDLLQQAYSTRPLVPTLHPVTTSSFADLRGPHETRASNAPSRPAGATLWYVPPYSPDLNPIELCFAKLTALVRTARCRRTGLTLWPFLGEFLGALQP